MNFISSLQDPDFPSMVGSGFFFFSSMVESGTLGPTRADNPFLLTGQDLTSPEKKYGSSEIAL